MGIPTVDEIMTGKTNIYLATVEGNQPRVRPVTMIKNEGAYYVITGSENAKTKQIRRNGKVEAVVPVRHEEKMGYVRFSAQAKIVSDSAVRTRVATATDFFGNYFESPDDPKYVLLHLIPKKAEYLKPDQMYPDSVEL